MAKAEAKTEEPLPKPKGKRSLLIIMAALAVVVFVGGGLAVWLLTSKPAAEGNAGEGGEAAAVEAEAGDEHPPIYEKLEQFTVNLSDGETYLQCEINLKVADSDVQERIKQRLPEVRDVLLRLLSSQTAEDLATLEGKDNLAKAVQKELNQVLGIKVASQGVQKVLFPAFIIQ